VAPASRKITQGRRGECLSVSKLLSSSIRQCTEHCLRRCPGCARSWSARGRAGRSVGAADPCRNHCRLAYARPCGCGRVKACRFHRRCPIGGRTRRGLPGSGSDSKRDLRRRKRRSMQNASRSDGASPRNRDFSVARANTAGVGRQKRLETLAALRRQLSVANPGRIDPSVITKCGSEQFRREILADRCPLPLILRKCSSALRK